MDAAGCWLPFPAGRQDTTALYTLNSVRAPKILLGYMNLDALNHQEAGLFRNLSSLMHIRNVFLLGMCSSVP